MVGLLWQAIHMTTARNFYNNRDCTGRFVRRVHVDELYTMGGWINTDDQTTHAHVCCGGLRGTTYALGNKPEGWMCDSCIDVPVPAHVLARQALANIAPSGYVTECDTCGDLRKATAFPTFIDSGYRMRGPTCRRCQQRLRESGRLIA